jgi:serine/threonine protein kinase
MARSDLLDDALLGGVPVAEGYRLLGGVILYQKIGQGGMGAVYRGRHLRLNVDVAVKVMVPPGGLDASQADAFVKRFVREAQTAAAVKHPNLIRVYDVNAEAGTYYLVMDYIEGESAADRLGRKGRPGLPEAEALGICLGAAEGLAAAHRRGIVHRDVKPDNILIDLDGHVVVADLGLAKVFARAEQDTALTMGLSVGVQAVGTPHYMSPEQTRSSSDLDPRSDVWSLGVTLYRLLSGAFPWRGDDLVELISMIRREDAPDLRGRVAGIGAACAGLVACALEKRPAARFADAGEMAARLRSVIDALPPAERARSLADSEAGVQKDVAIAATPPRPETLTLIGKQLFAGPDEGVASPNEGHRHARDAHSPRVRPIPGSLVPNSGAETWTFACPGRACAVAYSPDGAFLAAGCDDSRVFVWSARDGSPVATVTASAGRVWSVAFSPDSRRLAAACDNRIAFLWNVSDWKLAARLEEGHHKEVTSVAFSPDRIHLATGGTDRAVVVWDAQFGLPLASLIDHEMPVWSVAYAPDGKTLAVGSEDGTASLWRMPAGEKAGEIDTGADAVLAVAFSPDGALLATARGPRDGGTRGSVFLWTTADLREATTLSGHAAAVRSVAFASDGRMLATGSCDGTVKLWTPNSPQSARTCTGHDSWVWSVAFSPDGRFVASASSDRTVRVWQVSGASG